VPLGYAAGYARGKFDLLHIHEPITPSVSLLALWAAEQPVVATFHTATPRSRSLQLAGGVLRAAMEKIDAGIAVSESARNVVVQHLGRDAVVIPNGIAVRRLRHTQRAATPDDHHRS
jgi:phosphatidylinositol alpha-mannosyltransferase